MGTPKRTSLMKTENPRDKILKKVKYALGKGDYTMSVPELTSPVLKSLPEDDITYVFAENFVNTKGTFVFCENGEDFLVNLKAFISKSEYDQIHIFEKDLIESLDGIIPFLADKNNFENAQIGITTCEYLIARTGSILVSSNPTSGRSLGVFPHTHIVVAFTSQILPEISDGLKMLKQKYQKNMPSMISLVSGPSRTADIEKTLVLGAHGPKDLVLFLIDDTSPN